LIIILKYEFENLQAIGKFHDENSEIEDLREILGWSNDGG
jgi:hypothetical protein